MSRLKRAASISAVAIAAALACASPASAQTQLADASYADVISDVQVSVNKSKVLTARGSYSELNVGNSEIADVVALSRNQLYVVGKAIGSTNIILRNGNGDVIDVFEISVGHDIDGLKRKIFELAPDQQVEVRAANDSVVLSGSVDDAAQASAIGALAERFAPGKVTNMMEVAGSQQVLLEVRFAEVQRAAIKDIGTQLNVRDLDADASSFLGGPGGEFFGAGLDDVNPVNFFAGGVALVDGGNAQLDFIFDLLEEKGLVRTLAEPNMVALSGDTANFLAGGEFPIPVAQSAQGNQLVITVEFKEFGVGLAFTPTVTSKDSINLEMAAEVSSIDPTVSTSLGAIDIPGLKVRRTNTTVELRDGQSFAIAGLILDDLTSTMRQIPGLGSLPIIGALGRSEAFERRETELVVLITARLVQPVGSEQLAAPTDYIKPPSDMDYFLFGRTEEFDPAGRPGGVDGAYGYVQP